ncbi:mitochondrial ubiquitin ligase activator of NFKB 1-like isoform X1, partial [Gryllus bimaculatus]
MERGKQKIEKTRGHGVDEKKAERVFCDVLAEFVRSWKLSKDIKFPAANLLQGGKWLSERKSRSSVNDVTLSFGEAYSISHIDVGNCGSSFITIEVSRGQQRYQTLLPSTELMSGRDAQAKKNWSSVHMFSKEHFVEDVVEQKWNTVRVTCLQPFLQNEQFGLSFLKIFSIAEDELPVQPTQQLPPPGSVFQMMRDGTLGRAGPMVVNRSQQLVLAAIENQRTSLKCSSDLREAAESSSNGRDSLPDKTDLSLSKPNNRKHVLNGSARKSLYNKNCQDSATKSHTPPTTHKSFSPSSANSNKSIESYFERQSHEARQSSSSTVSNRKRTPPYDASGKSVGSLQKKQRTSALSPSSVVNNMKSPVRKATSRRKLWSSGNQLKLLQRQDHSFHGGLKFTEINDVTEISDSDSDTFTAVSPEAGVSTRQELIDCDSDEDTIINLHVEKTRKERNDNKEVVTLSSPEHSSSNILSLERYAVPGPSGIACPLCSDYFDVSSIEQHAAACGLTSGTDDSEMPEVLDVGPQLEQLVAKQPEKQLPYVAVRGSVKALGSPLHSLGAPDVPAVIQKLTCKEHVVADQERTLQETVNSVPFALTGHKGTRVEVVDALAAEVLDLETVVDHFEPSAPGLVDHLWGFFTGVRQRGLQNTEDVLREGALLTGVGTLTLVPSDPKGDLHLVPPADGAPFFLTAMSLHTLARHLDREKRMYKWLAVTFGAVGLILVGAAARRWWRSAERRAADAAAREATEVERRERRRRARSARDRDNVPEALLCVVCRLRERELVLLPCGHVCLCEECGEAVGPRCPVCRAQIEKRTAAYVAVKNICYLVDQGAIFNQDLSETTISLNFKLQCSFLQKLPQATVPESRADCILWFFSNKNQ